MSQEQSPATYGETPDEWYEREKTAFRAWWESDDNEKTFSSTPTMAAGAGWFARAEAAPETGPIVPCLATNGCATPEWCARNGDACRVKTPVSETPQSDACRAALANIMARIDEDEFIPTEYKEDAKKALASFPSAIQQKPPRDPNVKYPRLFYWEDAEDCWCPAEGLEVDNIISTDSFFSAGEINEIRFKREDMTDAEFEAIPEG